MDNLLHTIQGKESAMLEKFDTDNIILLALKEDMPFGDITTDSIMDDNSTSRAYYIAKGSGIIAGLEVSERVFKLLDDRIIFKKHIKDGDAVKYGAVFAEMEGSTKALLKGERTALNFLQHLSGIATKTRSFCDEVSDLPVKITDTRKTSPGLRYLEKYAVRAGGGYNHRFCLSDGVLIKDNHIKAAGGIKNAIELARRCIPHTVKIEVETETMEQVLEAVESRADIIMLDNMDNGMMMEAVKLISGRALVEASGNVSLDKLRAIAATGVDIISVGELTHTVKAFDISMKFL